MEEKKKHKVMIGIEVVLLCMLVAILRTNAASSNPPSNGVSYGKNSQTTVEGALNDLYNKANYGNASAGDILSGKTALVGGKKVTGTYKAPTLASQTQGDATPDDIEEGKIAWVNGDKIVGAKRKLSETMPLGAYVHYTPSSTSYTITKEDTGFSANQTINPSELTLWRVIQKKSDGTVEIVSEDVSSRKVSFCGETGYLRYIGTLNKIAKSYENSSYTVGSRHVGYDGTVEEYLSSIIGDAVNPDRGYQTDIDLLNTSIGHFGIKKITWSKSEIPYSEVNARIEYKGYLLASRAGVYNEKEVYAYHDVKTEIYSDRKGLDIFISRHANVNANEATGGYIRPIVVLRADLKITGGSGTVDSPYTIGI